MGLLFFSNFTSLHMKVGLQQIILSSSFFPSGKILANFRQFPVEVPFNFQQFLYDQHSIRLGVLSSCVWSYYVSANTGMGNNRT